MWLALGILCCWQVATHAHTGKRTPFLAVLYDEVLRKHVEEVTGKMGDCVDLDK